MKRIKLTEKQIARIISEQVKLGGDPGNIKTPVKGIKNWGCLHPDASPDTVCPSCVRDCNGDYPPTGDEMTLWNQYGDTSCCDWMLTDPYDDMPEPPDTDPYVSDMPAAPDKGNRLIKRVHEEILQEEIADCCWGEPQGHVGCCYESSGVCPCDDQSGSHSTFYDWCCDHGGKIAPNDIKKTKVSINKPNVGDRDDESIMRKKNRVRAVSHEIGGLTKGKQPVEMKEGKLVQAWDGSPTGGCVCVYAMEDGSYDHTTNYNDCSCTMGGDCCSDTNMETGGTLVGVYPDKKVMKNNPGKKVKVGKVKAESKLPTVRKSDRDRARRRPYSSKARDMRGSRM
tara:strand:+ start:746 stop:1762 length:1017 start_codon:yes stop_codon:yes gene_type:complete